MELENIYELMERFRHSGLAKLELREADTLIKMEMPRKTEPDHKQSVPVQLSPSVKESESAALPAAPAGHGTENYIRSPIVGTFYAAPEEGADPYVSSGDTVKKGSVVCIVEAMKMMNEIKAPFDCVIEEICVLNSSPVGFEEPLFRIREM